MKISHSMTMRDVFIRAVHSKMCMEDRIFFLSADFGSPMLDPLRQEFPQRFINVGIAEQNLITVATGLALEGFTVYAYAIAAFLVMRAYEQIRINLSLLSQFKSLNVNLIGVGAGVSYDVSGPSHHCLEDLALIRVLPHLEFFSPADWRTAEALVDHSIATRCPKYFRLDGKSLPPIYPDGFVPDLDCGWTVLRPPAEICIIATGFMVHTALEAVDTLKKHGVTAGVIDVYRIKPFAADRFCEPIANCKYLITLEEAFIGKGGLDGLIAGVILQKKLSVRLISLGFKDTFSFETGSREHLHRQAGIASHDVATAILNIKKTMP